MDKATGLEGHRAKGEIMTGERNRLDTIEQQRQRDRNARALSARCDRCGTLYHRSNLTPLKDGRQACTDCVMALVNEAADKKEDAR